MGLFSTSSSPFDQKVEHATSEKNTEDDWGQIMLICDKIKESSSGPSDALKSISKRLNNENPRVVLQTITLLDACINNCGRKFLLKVAERDFEQELSKLLTSTRTHHKVSEKLRDCLKKWAENEFKGDPELSLIPSLFTKLQQQGYDFNIHENSPKKIVKYSNDPNVVNTQQEEDDIARAIQLSLQESDSSSQKSSGVKIESSSPSLYSSASAVLNAPLSAPSEKEKEPNKVRALYDFEAVEDNELTFKAGEIILVIDNSDPNWWKGTNHRGEGLFPANFVTDDLHEEIESNKSALSGKRVSFSESVEVTEVNEDAAVVSGISPNITGEIDEEKIDQLLHLLHEADPTGEREDDPSLPLLEEHVNAMAPSIDAELEQIDRKHAQLARISTDLVEALNLYHQLMREMPPSLPYYQPYNKTGTPGSAGTLPGGPMPHYMTPGPPPAMSQIYHQGQYPRYASPNSAMTMGYLPPQSSFAPLPQNIPQMNSVPQQPFPIQDFQQIPPNSQANYQHFVAGAPAPYGGPLEGNELTSLPSVLSQGQAPPAMQTQPPSMMPSMPAALSAPHPASPSMQGHPQPPSANIPQQQQQDLTAVPSHQAGMAAAVAAVPYMQQPSQPPLL